MTTQLLDTGESENKLEMNSNQSEKYNWYRHRNMITRDTVRMRNLTTSEHYFVEGLMKTIPAHQLVRSRHQAA